MAANIATLAALLASDVRYDAAVTAGKNGDLVRLLNDIETGSAAVWLKVPLAKVKEAVIGHPLTADQIAQLDFFLGEQQLIDFGDADTRSFLTGIFTGPPGLPRLRAIARRDNGTYAETAGVVGPGERVTLSDVRRAVRRVAKAHIIASGQAAQEG